MIGFSQDKMENRRSVMETAELNWAKKEKNHGNSLPTAITFINR
jgi:hypothetical protein